MSGSAAYSGDNGVTWIPYTFSAPGAAQVLGSPIATPEPSAVLLLASLIGIFGIKIRRKQSNT